MEFVPFETTFLRKEGKDYWLDLEPEIPKRLGWKDNCYLIIALTKNKNLLLQTYTPKLLYNLLSDPKNHVRTTLLRSPYRYQSNYLIDIPQSLIQEIKPKRAQPFAPFGINRNQLLILKLP